MNRVSSSRCTIPSNYCLLIHRLLVLFQSRSILASKDISKLRWLKPASVFSKIKFRSGGSAPLEWTRFTRAVRDPPVADYSAPRVKTTRHLAYHTPIAVSPFRLVLSVSYFKQSLWGCGQLWPYVAMVSVGRRLHRDCHAKGNIAKISSHILSTCAQSAILSILIIYIISRGQINVPIDNPFLVPSVSCLSTSSYLRKYVCTFNKVSHDENLQSNGFRCISQLYKFWDRIEVTTVFRYCGERQR